MTISIIAIEFDNVICYAISYGVRRKVCINQIELEKLRVHESIEMIG